MKTSFAIGFWWRRGGALRMGLVVLLVKGGGWDAAPAAPEPRLALKLLAPASFLPNVPLLVRVELHRGEGARATDIWDAEASLDSPTPGAALSTNRVSLYNGLGTALVSASHSGDFDLVASVGSLRAGRRIRSLAGQAITSLGGTLSGSETFWRGVIRVTNDLTVPANHTLQIESNTWVLIDGVASGTTAPDLLVNGRILCLGTEAHPITLTCANPSLRWGQIRHHNAQPSLYRHTSITRGGRAPGEGHTGQGPVLRPTNSRLVFESCNLTDYAEPAPSSPTWGRPGKVMQASGSDITLVDCVLARARMGPEIGSTALLCTNSYLMEMFGPDDADGIYLHDQQPSQEIKLSGCVIARGDDDGIDTLGSTVTIEHCIVRDWRNPAEDAKGVSGFNGTMFLRHCLFADCASAVSTKSSSPTPARVFMEQCTVLGESNAVWAAWKSNATNGVIDFRITNCILRASDAVRSDFGSTNFTLRHCNVSEPWPGEGNLTADPLFVDAATRDFRLRPYSPCIDAGALMTPLDADGSPADVGYSTFEPPAPALSQARLRPAREFEFILNAYSNRLYRVEFSEDLRTWQTLRTITQTREITAISDAAGTNSATRVYRVKLGQ